ncbi:Predicted ATP-dependent endonuclease of the OLD family, contains P-loop ATPase and TOPRIM domains [Bacillus sp. ok061]|uniref:ATP-dependent nuclease n=1 Tax=Bacillus sp. ok061 TaxID=1761766 RepID=UPI00089EA9BF|nr:AAA family ATPase [Bacillus sp. ok061]SEG01754.1 Predicted ATP-dependent endonuclease of the OLD family, contains P-loop ATPase and TOPRIM domains [Bacillus sp. ok061]
MRLKKFSVTNYKVFKETFSIDFSTDSIAILTGRNNTGKSTFLEAINCFFLKETKATTISNECFSKRNKEIVLEAHFESDDETLIFKKKYKEETAPKYYDAENIEMKASHPLKEKFDAIYENKPYYITPSMSTDDINNQIQAIYSQIIKGDLQKLEEEPDPDHPADSEHMRMRKEYVKIKESLPNFLRKLKTSTDELLDNVSEDVSSDLRGLFSNDALSLKVLGGESTGFSTSDILKSTNSSVYIDNHLQKGMPLSNQGTGLQRMSLIYLIQNMIQKKLMGDNDDKMLLIDEPEAFLHPEAVRALSRSLYTIGNNMPLIISTHSPILIDLSEKHTSIQVFRVGETEAVQLYKSVNDKFDDDDIRNMKILNYVDSYVNEFFFAEKILIVEGDTEYIALKHRIKKNNENVHIIRARGKSTICTLMKILNQFNANYNVLHDVDNHNKYSSATLKAQLTNCKNILKLKTNDSIRIYCSMENFEAAIGIGDVSNDKKTQTIHEIIHETETETDLKYMDARQEIDNLFEHMIKHNDDIPLGEKFFLINCEKDYEGMFSSLIEQKLATEEAEKTAKLAKELAAKEAEKTVKSEKELATT